MYILTNASPESKKRWWVFCLDQ